LSALGCLEPESKERDQFQVADRLLASFPSMLLYWHQFHKQGRRIETQTGDTIHGRHFLHLLRGPNSRTASWSGNGRFAYPLWPSMSLMASTFAARITASDPGGFLFCDNFGDWHAARSLHGGANEEAMGLIERFETPEQAEAGLMRCWHANN